MSSTSAGLLRMHRRAMLPVIAWLALTLIGGFVLVRMDIAERRARFQAEAGAMHRMLSQQAAQHDAVLASLVVLDPGQAREGRDDPLAARARPGESGPLQRLPALYPQILAVQRRTGEAAWLPDWPGHARRSTGATGTSPDSSADGLAARLAEAEARSRAQPGATRSAVMTAFDPAAGRYALVLAGDPASYALWIDARQLATSGVWPMAPGSGAASDTQQPRAIEMRLAASGGVITLHDGDAIEPVPFGLTEGFRFDEPIDSPAQPFLLSLRRATGPAQWPWPLLVLWAAAAALLVAAVHAQRRAREAQRRSAEMARLGQMAQLNSLGELAAGMAHELNQPLAAVLGSTQAARRWLAELDGPAPDSGQPLGLRPVPQGDASPAWGGPAPDSGPPQSERQAALAQVHDAVTLAAGQARRAADVLARLRRLVEPGHGDRAREPVDPLRSARQLVSLLGPELQRQGIHVSLTGDRVTVRTDPVALEQVLYNLIRNAMQALSTVPPDTPDRRTPPRIIVQVTPAGAQARISVRDNGPGIAAEALPRLFEPFYTTRARGLGLGLALCETLARAQDGMLEAVSHADGAEFVLILPLVSCV